MKYGISTACFYPEALEDTVLEIARLKTDTAEVFINTETEFSAAFVAELRARFDAHGIRVISVHPYTSPMEGQLLLSEYTRRTEDGIQQYRRYFAAAQALGAKYFTFHGERSIIRDVDEADAERKLGVYARLCEIAGEYGMILAQENVAWCKSESPAYLRRLHDRVPALCFTLDIKQGHRAGHSWSEYLEAVGDRLVNIHINDFDDTHSCLLPGEGVVDFEAFFSRLHALGYDRQVLIEVYRGDYQDTEQINRSLDYLRSSAARRRLAIS